MANRFARQDWANDALKHLEFSEDIFEQKRLIDELKAYDQEMPLGYLQRARLNFMIEEVNAKIDDVFKLKEQSGPLRPPFPLSDGELN